MPMVQVLRQDLSQPVMDQMIVQLRRRGLDIDAMTDEQQFSIGFNLGMHLAMRQRRAWAN